MKLRDKHFSNENGKSMSSKVKVYKNEKKQLIRKNTQNNSLITKLIRYKNSQHSVLLSNAEALDGYFLTISTVLNLVIKHQTYLIAFRLNCL